jgi:predicted ATPase/DNA-binding XRE family transcriptional regulator
LRSVVTTEVRLSGSSEFGALLREYRLNAGLSQEALAERARMSTNGVSALERGYRRTPQRETLVLLASALTLDEEQRREFESAAARSAPRRHGLPESKGGAAGHAPSTLPLALTSFVGRAKELDEIVTLARAHRLVTLTGAGGIGKTQTALQVSKASSDSGDGALCFVGLEPITDPSLVTAAIASALGVQEVPAHPLVESLAAYLKNKPLLLILDNCEHVLVEAARVAETLLHTCPHLRILATSRAPLRAAGEYAYRVPSLTAGDAIALFADRARAVNNHFAIAAEDAEVVANICRRLDGIPLAIELAAARLNLLSLRALDERLDDRFRILTGGGRTALPRQQTLRATIDWSYNLLSPREQRTFERLAVFVGGCTLSTAAVVCGDDHADEEDMLDLLSSLVDKSLVTVDLEGNEPRYRLLDSFQQYAREKLAQHDEQNLAPRRHARAYLAMAEQLDRSYGRASEEALRAEMSNELGNCRAALQWALTERNDIVLGQGLVGRLNIIWLTQAPLEGRRWLVEAARFVNAETPMGVVAALGMAEACIALGLSEYDVLLTSSRRSIAYYRALNDELSIARALHSVGYALICLGRAQEAKVPLEEALAIGGGLGNRRLVGLALVRLATVSSVEGDLVTARSLIAEARQNLEEVDAKVVLAASIGQDLSWIEFLAGNVELALRYALSLEARIRDVKREGVVADTLDFVAIYLTALGRYDEAEGKAREMLDLAREHYRDELVAYALQHLAAIAVLRPQPSLARAKESGRKAARMLGFVDARLAEMRVPRLYFEQPEYGRVRAVLADALGGDAVSALAAAGAALSEEEAIAEATAPSPC